MSDGSPRVTIFLINFSLLFFGVTWSISFCKLLSFLQPAPLSLLLSNSRICFDLLVLLSIFGVQRIRSSSAFFFPLCWQKRKEASRHLFTRPKRMGILELRNWGNQLWAHAILKGHLGFGPRRFVGSVLGGKTREQKFSTTVLLKPFNISLGYFICSSDFKESKLRNHEQALYEQISLPVFPST